MVPFQIGIPYVTDPRRMNWQNTPHSKVHGANMGPIWGGHDQGGPHVGPMNFAIWDVTLKILQGNTYI